MPVFEAILRIARGNETVTPERIAQEALLHLGDVYDALAELVTRDYIRIMSDGEHADPAVVLSPRLRFLVKSQTSFSGTARGR